MAYRMLAVGSQSELLATRNVVLRESGFSIHSRKPSQALTLFREEDFDVVLLCHTIPVKDAERLIRLLKEEQPHTPVVVMSNGHRASGADATIDSLDSPEELLRQMVEVMAAASAPRRDRRRTT